MSDTAADREVGFTPGPWEMEVAESHQAGLGSGVTRVDVKRGFLRIAGVTVRPGLDAIANGYLIAAAPGLYGEHTRWSELFGEALTLALQGDYSAVDRLAKEMEIVFPDGAPVLRSSALSKARGETP